VAHVWNYNYATHQHELNFGTNGRRPQLSKSSVPETAPGATQIGHFWLAIKVSIRLS